jgi:hypothetical protein
MPAQRIDEIIELLQSFVLGETNLSKRQVKVGLKLLDLTIDDAAAPDDGVEVLMSAFAFPRKFAS